MKSLVRFALVCAFAMPLAACAAIFGFDDLVGTPTDDTPEGDAEPPDDDAGDSATADGGDPCTQLGLPEAPAVTTDGGTSLPDVHMAFSLFDFGIGTVPPTGFNLDRTCSPTLATSSCTVNEPETTYEKYARDIDNKGTDNASYGLLKYLAQLGEAFRPENVNERLAAGEFGFVVRIIDWNGLPDDPEVFVEIFPTVGIALDPDASSPVPGGTPTFTSSDVWLRDQRFEKVTEVDASSIRSTRAFVTGGRLVSTFSTATLPISVPDDTKPLDITVQEGFLVGDLVTDTDAGAGYRLANGVLAGRWRTLDALDQIRQIFLKDTLGVKNVVLCDPGAPTTIYDTIKAEVCDGRDLRGASADDNKGMPCDAVSSGIRFDSYAIANPGPFYTRAAIPARCVVDGSVPSGDNCP